jgi:hypothetical protein
MRPLGSKNWRPSKSNGGSLNWAMCNKNLDWLECGGPLWCTLYALLPCLSNFSSKAPNDQGPKTQHHQIGWRMGMGLFENRIIPEETHIMSHILSQLNSCKFWDSNLFWHLDRAKTEKTGPLVSQWQPSTHQSKPNGLLHGDYDKPRL